jgi:hypothetical protein
MSSILDDASRGPHALLTHDRDILLLAKVIARFRGSGYAPLMRLDCRVVDGVVELVGCVPTFHLKQIAQHLVLRIGNVKGIRNEVVVG